MFRSKAYGEIQDIYSKNKLKNALVLEANNFSSSYLENLGKNQFSLSKLPLAAQLSPIYSIKSGDFNNDEHLDLLLAGNFFGMRINFGRLDANKGLVLLGDGKGNFNELPNNKSGLFINGEVKDIALLDLGSGKEILAFTLNNDSLRLYQKSKGQNVEK